MENILFDLDGTLVASHPGILTSLKYTIDTLQIDCLRQTDLLRFVGPPLRQSFIDYAGMSQQAADEAVRVFRKYYAEKGIFDSLLYEGIEPMLQRLSKTSRLFITTSKPEAFARQLADYFQITPCFTGIIGSRMDNSFSGKKEIIEYAIGTYRLCRQQTIMAGDKYQDVRAAAQCKIPSVGVLYGYGTLEELKQGGATCIAKDVPTLETILAK